MFSVLAISLFSAALAVPLPDSTPRIVNGTDAKAGEFPYIVSLKIPISHSCGGSILDATHILTAAHCVFGDLNPNSYNVQYGLVDITSDGTNTLKVEKVVHHENYTLGYGYHNDVAVIKLASPIPLSNVAQPVKLPAQGSPTPGNQPAVLVGWGIPFDGGDLMEHLQKVDIKVYSDKDCKAAHGADIDSRYNLCAGVPEGGKGQCSGDSGGPLTVDGVQVGIVSWSVKPCTLKGYPGVFAKVSTYVDWIRDKIDNM